MATTQHFDLYPAFVVWKGKPLSSDWVASEWVKLNKADLRLWLDFSLSIGHLDEAEILVEAGKMSEDGASTELLYSVAPHRGSIFTLSNDWWKLMPLPDADCFRVSAIGRGDTTGSSLSVIGSIPTIGGTH